MDSWLTKPCLAGSSLSCASCWGVGAFEGLGRSWGPRWFRGAGLRRFPDGYGLLSDSEAE